MVLYDENLAMNFPAYGIRIPVLDSRAASIVSRLSSIPGLSGQEWLVRGVGPRLGREDLARVHDAAFVDRLFAGGASLEAELLKTYELIGPDGKPHRYEPETATKPLSDLFGTILDQVTGTYRAARLALDSGFCFYLGGGMHHARRDEGSGFCLVNDSMVAVAALRAAGLVRAVWIIDVDAHKGDGSAELALDDEDTLTLSIHMAEGWPLDLDSLAEASRRGRGEDKAPLAPSDVDIPVPRGADADYCRLLSEGLSRLVQVAGGKRPDLAIVVDGADPYAGDGLPSSDGLALSLDQCVRRDILVRDFLRKRGIPSAWLMAGGYGERAWEPPAAFLERVLTE